MQFDYEIPADEYAAAQVLYHTARDKTRLIKRALCCILPGALLVLVALTRWIADWAPILLLLNGALFIYWGIANLSPTRYFRRAYSASELSSKNYHAELDENGFSVSGDACHWRVLWTEVRLKAENKKVLILYAKGTIFIFGKRYLSVEQQRDVRQLATMP